MDPKISIIASAAAVLAIAAYILLGPTESPPEKAAPEAPAPAAPPSP